MYSAQVGVHSASIGLTIEETEAQKTAEIGSLSYTMRKRVPPSEGLCPLPQPSLSQDIPPCFRSPESAKRPEGQEEGSPGSPYQ